MSENRNLVPANEHFIRRSIDFPLSVVQDPDQTPELVIVSKDGVEPIRTAFAHDSYVSDLSRKFLEEIWVAKNHDKIGREAMLLKFDEIDSEYELSMNDFLRNAGVGEIQLSDTPSQAVLRELAVLFKLADEHEAIMAVERQRIEEEKRERIRKAHDFFIGGLIASTLSDEFDFPDETDI